MYVRMYIRMYVTYVCIYVHYVHTGSYAERVGDEALLVCFSFTVFLFSQAAQGRSCCKAHSEINRKKENSTPFVSLKIPF